MKHLKILFLALLLCGHTPKKPGEGKEVYRTDNLVIRQVDKQVYIHTSALEIEGFGKFPCNGMIVTRQHEAAVFDTPTTDAVSLELIQWIESELQCTVKAVVPTHFHEDCLGGLATFHRRGIPSYSHALTQNLARENGPAIPEKTFDGSLELEIGSTKAIVTFFGEGHTRDNVVAYFPDGQVLFGGCLIKEMGAGKGNLRDANTDEWPHTVRKIKTAYPDLQTVIPGHGSAGGPELLDYTIQLFEQK